MEEDSTLDYNSLDVDTKRVKKKTKKKDRSHASSGPETGGEAEAEEAETPKRKEKPFDAQENKMHRKKKEKQFLIIKEEEDGENERENVECLQINSDDVMRKPKRHKKKRKEKLVAEEENGENQNEENDTAAVDQLEMIREVEVQESKTPKKKKKKKTLEAEDSNTRDDQVLELVTPRDQTDEHKARRRKRKKGQVQEEDSSISEPTTSCIGETTISENTDSEVFVSLKKKKKKRITDALQADADSEIQSASKSPGRHEQLQDSLQVTETGSDCEPQLGETPRKRKKKKRHSQHGDDEQPESSYVATEHDNLQVSASETRPESPDNDPSVSVVEAQLTKVDDDDDDDDDDGTIVPKEEGALSMPASKKRAREPPVNVRKRDLRLLKEYFPNLSSFSKKTVNNLISCELERVKEAKQRGVIFNRGRFTDEENKQLTENVKSFLELSGIKNEEMLFHSYRYPEEKKLIEEIKKKFNFRLRISEGIPRAVQEICHRGVKLFDFSGNKGRFTDEEVKQLKKNWKIHGNNWIAVGALMGRNNIKVQLKASQLRRNVNKGAWSVEETNLLISAVKEYILSLEEHATSGNESDIIIQKAKLYKGIPWVQIEEKVKTRNWTQCKTKWTEILFLRMNNGVSMFEGISGVESQMKIIQWLYECGPKESGQVNWEELADHIGNVPPMILQIKYYNLKALHVPDWQKLSFKEIVNYLYTEVVPMFAEKLNANQGRQKQQVEAFEKRDGYSVSEIFFEYTDNEKEGSEKVKRKKSTKKFYAM